MKLGIIGAGAIGSLVAAELTKAGHDVLLIGRKDHVAAITKDGLLVRRPDGSERVKIKAAETLPSEFPLVVFATKTQDIEEAYYQNAKFLEDSLVLTTQNGVQADNLLSSHFNPEQIISSIVMFGATYTKPGEVTVNFPGDWIIGKPYVPNDARVHEIAAEFRKTLPVVVSDRIMGMKWLKLFINFNNCIPALIGKPMQETFADLDFCRLSVRLLQEGVAIVKSAKIDLVSLPNFPVERILGLAGMPLEQAAGIVNKTLTALSRDPLYGSILQSIMRGKTSEIDFINGEVVLLASSLRDDAPLNRKVVRMVHEVEERGRFFSPEDVKREFELS